MDGREQTHAAARQLPDRDQILRLRDLIHRDPVRIHAAQQHQHPLRLLAAGEHVRTWAKVERADASGGACQLQPLIDDRNALPGSGQDPDAAAQQRRFAAARRAGKQAGAVQIRPQQLRRMADLARDADGKR